MGLLNFERLFCIDKEPTASISTQVSKMLNVGLPTALKMMSKTEDSGYETPTADEGQTSAEENHTHAQRHSEARSHDFNPQVRCSGLQ